MFEDSLVESSGKLAARHPFATAVSFAAQIIVLSALLLLSLLYTETLPTQRWINMLQAPPPPPSAPAPRSVAIASNRSGALSDALVVPSEIPKSIADGSHERTAPEPPSGIAGDILGSVPDEFDRYRELLAASCDSGFTATCSAEGTRVVGRRRGHADSSGEAAVSGGGKDGARRGECCLAGRHWQGRQHPKPSRDQRPSAADFSRAGGGEAMAIQALLSKWGTSRGGNANRRQLPVNTRLALR